MDKVIEYFALNFVGFFVFNEIWKRIRKPPPIDYTTIPGLKNPELEETEEAITFDPGTLIIERSSHKGCLKDFENMKITEILDVMSNDYGSLSSAFFGSRYIVLLSGENTIAQLEAYKDESSGICPFAFGSVILGDPFFWIRKKEEEWVEIISQDEELRDFISYKNQESLVLNFPESGKTVWGRNILKKNKVEKVDLDSTILVYSFDVEIDIDGHRIPAFIPILVYLPTERK